jgi:hypothetical protein
MALKPSNVTYEEAAAVVRDALSFYLREKESRRIIGRLKELQKSPLRSTIQEDLKLLRQDRDR